MNPRHPGEDELAEAVRVIAAHGVVAFPTETFYGLAVSVFDQQGCARIFELKGRPSTKALACIISDVGELARVADHVAPVVHQLASRFWPGPLTLVLPARREVVAASEDATIAVRVSSSLLARRLAERAGPITSTSANPSGAAAPRTADAVDAAFGDAVELILDGGVTPGGLPSTIIAVTGSAAGRGLTLVREGAIPFQNIESI